jgi:hypothetical protein
MKLDENVFLVPYKEEFAVLVSKILFLWVIKVKIRVHHHQGRELGHFE